MGDQGAGGYLIFMRTTQINPMQVFRSLLPNAPLFMRSFWLVLIIFGILFGSFVSRVFSVYQRTDMNPQWHQAQWITTGSDSAVAYYRRNFVLDYLPTKAYIQIAAPDSFKLYINGQFIQETTRASTAVYGIFDIANYLQAGQNIIAIRVERKTIPGSANLLANLQWLDPTDIERTLVTDELWRASAQTQRQNDGTLEWYENSYDEITWHYSQLLATKEYLPIQSLHPWATPELITLFPRGSWISDGFSETAGTSYVREFNLGDLGRGDIKSAWLGVACTTPYTLIINGVRSPMMEATAQKMTTHNIGNFLAAGKNTIAIDTSNVNGSGRIAISAIVKTSDQFFDLSADENWRVRTFGGTWLPATMMGKLNSYSYTDSQTGFIFRTPVIQLTELHLPGGLLVRQMIAALPWIISSSLVALCILIYGFSGVHRLSIAVIKIGMLPWLLADLLLCIALILPFDITITEIHIFNLPVLFAISSIALILFFLIMAEFERGRISH